MKSKKICILSYYAQNHMSYFEEGCRQNLVNYNGIAYRKGYLHKISSLERDALSTPPFCLA